MTDQGNTSKSRPATESAQSMWQGAVNAVNAFNPMAHKGTPKEHAAEKDRQPTKTDTTVSSATSATPKEKTWDAAATAGAAGRAAGRAAATTVNGAAHFVRSMNPMAYDDSESDDCSTGSSGERDPVEHPEKQEVLRKKETALAVLLKSAKNKYVEKGLVGKVTIQILVGVVTSGEFCTINKADNLEDVQENELKQLGALNFRALSAMDAILANLSRRSKQYAGRDLRGDVTLTQGITFGIGIPFLISVGFQTAIQFEVTAASLVDYLRRKEKLRTFKKKLKKLPNAAELISFLIASGFSLETAQRAVVATEGAGEAEALRWAVDNDKEYAISERLQCPY